MVGPRFVILLIDSDLAWVSLFEQGLKKAGIDCSFHAVADGKSAIRYLTAARAEGVGRFPDPTLVLLEVNLVDQAGLDVLRRVRVMPHLIRLPIVMLSASAIPTDVQRSYELGANSFLVKPTTLDEIVSMVRQLHTFWGQINHGIGSGW